MSFNTALIVDDSKLARVALKKKLELRGLQIILAEGAKQALGLLENTPIDIVFMDHLMPDMDGFQATQEIKANVATAHLPVIMCSGKEKQGYLEEARAIGASNVLPKPAENEAIAAVFAELEEAAQAAADRESAIQQQVAAPAQEPGFGEAQVQGLLQPLAGQLDTVSSQFSALAQDIDDRFGVVADTLQSIEDKQLAVEPVDVQSISDEWRAQMDQRFASLDLPDAGQMQSELKQALGAELRSELGEQWDNSLKVAILEAMAGLEQLVQAAQNDSDQSAAVTDEWLAELEQRLGGTLTASFTQLLEDKGRQLEASVQQQFDSLRAELSQELDAVTSAATMDLDTLRQSLKAELIDEMSQAIDDSCRISFEEEACGMEASLESPDQGVAGQRSPGQKLQSELRTVKILTFGGSLLAIAAIALHWL